MIDKHMEYGWFFENFINTKHTLLGLELKPFSTHHYINLQAIKSPVLSGDGQSNILDLIMACLICSSTYGDDINDFFSQYEKRRVEHLKSIHDACSKNDRFVLECFESFSKYMEDYCIIPPTIEMFGENLAKDKLPGTPNLSNEPVKVENVNIKTPPIPPVISNIVVLMSKMGMTEEQAMNLSLGKVHTYVHTYMLQQTGETKVLANSDFIGIQLALGQIDPRDLGLV